MLNNVNAGMLKKLATVRVFFSVKAADTRETEVYRRVNVVKQR
ncbi:MULTISPECIES: hypothetical protein [Paenibacillus]|uniref:Uncharacterized protein n=1 Tax=Paenibacillus violae TaxID=3077234 RepID=A0ABU3RFN6_9BACL|nr:MULTISPECIES: hypothetical protein [Paenibacillus]MDU0202839.1 hypothetical protein [Paenibacillus sp. PFR10]MEC0266637.1 hypothetical protein [Paenibacillus anseongense]